jgi:flagellar transcriptional activator FlhD
MWPASCVVNSEAGLQALGESEMAGHAGRVAGESLADETAGLNYAWMVLAQRLLQEDFARGLPDLGLTPEAGRILASLSQKQIRRLARSSQVICRFGIKDQALFASLIGKGEPRAVRAAHRAE